MRTSIEVCGRGIFVALSPLAVAAVVVPGCAARDPGVDPAPRPVPHEQFTETLDGTTVSFVMKPVPAGRFALQDGSGVGGGQAGIGPFWISETEVTWDAYDVYLFGPDEQEAAGDAGPDAVTRPSKPYISVDRGFGHAGYPAISMSYLGALSFCEWLSRRTGRRYRLPTQREWRYVCRLGAVDGASADEHAWYRSNADFRTHPVATRAPDALGLYDLWGNASEWCTGPDGSPVTLGGSYRDPAGGIGCGARVLPSDAWNESDPQVPKSVWWLADAGFVGFRVVCEPPEHDGEEP
jgi:formylglycine-generating enzyme required for sulfatase activity